jgi:hypothetical protein
MLTGSVFCGKLDTKGGFVGGIVGKVEKHTLTIENCLSNGNITNTYVDTGSCFVAGILGGGTNVAADNWTIKNCIVGGTFNITQASLNGIVIGHRRWSGATRVASNVYVLSSAVTAGDGKALALDGGGSNSKAGYIDITGKSVSGYDAIVNAPNLDFHNAWVARKGDVPMPRGVVKSDALVTPDVVWTKNADNKYEITSMEELAGLACMVNGVALKDATLAKADAMKASYVLTNDLVLNEDETVFQWIPIGNTSDGFQGTFDGQGHTIEGIYVNSTEDSQGLFGTIANAATVKNFSLKNSRFYTTGMRIGSIAGSCYGTVSNVYSNADVESPRTGTYARVAGMFGLLGGSGEAKVSSCWFDGTVTAAGDMVGGIAGQVGASKVTLTDCLSTATIVNTYDAASKTGGLLGWIQNHAKLDLVMTNCYSDCTISTMRDYQVGKVIGMIGNSSAWLGSVVVSNVYASNFEVDVNGVIKTLGGASSAASIKTGTITVLPIDKLEEESGFDFTNLWKVQNGTVELIMK